MNEVVQIVDGQTDRHRALIVQISKNAFRVDIERLYDSVDAGGEKRESFWSTLNEWTSFTDTLENALELAAENIRISECSDVSYG